MTFDTVCSYMRFDTVLAGH